VPHIPPQWFSQWLATAFGANPNKLINQRRTLPGAGQPDNYEHDIILPPKQPNRRAKGAKDRASQPTFRERAVDLVKQEGLVKADDFKNVGVYRPQLAKLCSEGLLTRIARGRYAIGAHALCGIGDPNTEAIEVLTKASVVA